MADAVPVLSLAAVAGPRVPGSSMQTGSDRPGAGVPRAGVLVITRCRPALPLTANTRAGTPTRDAPFSLAINLNATL